MKAIVQDRYGSADVLELRTVARPEPAADEVLIEVHAAGVDRGVEHLMTGRALPGAPRLRPAPTQAADARLDVAGRVVAIGAATTRFRIGDEVMGIATGAFAEYAVAKEAKLVHKPAQLSFTSGRVPISGGTAAPGPHRPGSPPAGGTGARARRLGWRGQLRRPACGRPRCSGDRRGQRSESRDGRALGAERVIDHRTEDFVADGPVYDLIIDAGGRNPILRLRKALTERAAW